MTTPRPSESQTASQIVDSWLASGGHVIASSVRAARFLANTYHQRRRAEGMLAWPTPSIFDWDTWVTETWTTLQWQSVSASANMALTPLQERSLWARIIRSRPVDDGISRIDRLAAATQQAYKMLAAYAPDQLSHTRARSGWPAWSSDAEIFSQWITAFEELCRRESCISTARIPDLLTQALATSPFSERPPLLLIGFDRIHPAQQILLYAWGRWRQESAEAPPAVTHFHVAHHAAEELHACLSWLYAQRRANPAARLMIVATNLSARRGEIERTLLDLSLAPPGEPLLSFEFSLGVPLHHTSLVRAALFVLRWLYGPLEESELDWLLLTRHTAISEAESLALARALLAIRENGREQPHWTISDFIAPDMPSLAPPPSWSRRVETARQIHLSAPRQQSPLDWVAFTSRILETIGWPGYQPESSAAWQARDRWETLLDACASLGFDGSELTWPAFVTILTQTAAETIFATESSSAQLQITEPFPSAGQTADAIWFLGAHEEAWPLRGQPHPLIPLPVQRQYEMPHSSHLIDWQLAHNATTRILHSAAEVVFSYARQAGEVEQRPSRLITQLIGDPILLPAQPSLYPEPLTELFEDPTRLPFRGIANSPRPSIGGAETLTAQSLCPFQSFANKRLNAPSFDPAETGLNARQRGQLLHAALHRIWSGPASPQPIPGAISTHAELAELPDLEAFVRVHVAAALHDSFETDRRSSLPSRFPARILDLEAQRLIRLLTEWLAYERTRLPFTVTATERPADVSIAGLRLRLRLDRIDQVVIETSRNDGSIQNVEAALILDYKSSPLGPSAWSGDRPDNLQLPLYATEALRQPIEGLLIAQVRLGEPNLCGRVANATQSLFPTLTKQNGLIKNPLTIQQLDDWRTLIESLAMEFLNGHAAVTPKNPAKTCAACGLHSVCRIYDNEPLAAHIADDNTGEPEDESATT
ncbi:MAG TPA: PD-(D/E)XK nuclease family protein [Acidobacteriaceae bacterium]|nr:PD-(D/E)XK nuclease family protein [Acidobacteriaceae bacterium]